MSEDVGCARPTGASVTGSAPKEAQKQQDTTKEAIMTLARVGKPAPDFTAPAYHKGTFGAVKLSDYVGKWTMLCFYPGDFTFV